MNLRRRFLRTIIVLMGLCSLLLVMLFEVEHLRREQGRLRFERRFVRSVLMSTNSEKMIIHFLRGMRHSRLITNWSLQRWDGEHWFFIKASSSEADMKSGAEGNSVSFDIPVNGYAVRATVFFNRTHRSLMGSELGGLLLAMLLSTGFLAIVMYFMVNRLVLDPISDMLLAIHKLGAGEKEVEVGFASRKDELGRLANAFNHMSREVVETRDHLEEKVREATLKVEDAQRKLAFTDRLAATGRLAAGVAHEINNPLGGVMNAVARIKKGNLDEEKTRTYLDLVNDGLGRIQVIVRRILDFARKKPEVRAVDIREPVNGALELCMHRIRKENIVLNVAFGDNACVMADSGELQQVFLNLINNALDAMEGVEGKLNIVSANMDDSVSVEVCDNGAGLNEEDIPALFDYFHTTKPAGKGTGLGLSISHNIITRYGGSLRLSAGEEQGAVAAVNLPLAKSQ